MTTKDSALHLLKAQADNIAKMLKAASKGETVAADPAGKIKAALAKEAVRFAVVMDDKILSIEMPWSTIRGTDEAGISEWILQHMREQQQSLS